eukprot:scaffold961_cov122-Cylindrotheca_fusiformis.AAC.39
MEIKEGLKKGVDGVKNNEALQVANGLDTFKSHAGLKPYFDNAHGFVVFEKVGKAGIGIGGAFGTGNVYVNNKDGTETLVGTSNLMQVSLGLQLGGQLFSEIIFFESMLDYERFTSGSFEFGADAKVVALTASASVSASTMGNQGLSFGTKPSDQSKIGKDTEKYAKGLAVFTVALTGLMYEATVTGQKFTYKPIEEASNEEVLTE